MLAVLAFAFTGLAALSDEAPSWPDWARFRMLRTLEGPQQAWQDLVDSAPVPEGENRWNWLQDHIATPMQHSVTNAKSLEELVPLVSEFGLMFLAYRQQWLPWDVTFIPTFADAPYGIDQKRSITLSAPDKDGIRHRIKKTQKPGEEKEEGQEYRVLSWDRSRILIGSIGSRDIEKSLEIQPLALLVAPEAVTDGVLWADLPPSEQVRMAEFISRDATDKDRAKWKAAHGTSRDQSVPPGFRWSDAQDGVLLPPGLDERQRVVLPNADEGGGHDAILDEVRDPKPKARWRRGVGHLWRLEFGMFSPDNVLVWTDSDDLTEALEKAAEWLKDNAPGNFTEPEYKEAAEEAGLPWPMPDDGNWDDYESVIETAEADLTRTESGFLSSDEWHANEVKDAMILRWAVLQDPDVLEKALVNWEEGEDDE